MGSKAKDAAAKLHEKHQTILADLLRDEDNKFCADCKAKGPRWASWNLGVFVCIRCAGIHRNLGVHISRVKSVNLDSWTPEQIESIQRGGNRPAREKYEANLPANFRRPQDDYAVEQFIRAKYERKQYMDRDGAKSTTTAKTVQDQKPKAKKTVEKKVVATTATQRPPKNQVISVPRPTSGRSSPQPSKLTPSSPITKSSSARNLISLDSTTKQTQRTPDLLTGLQPSTMTVRNSASSPDILSHTQKPSQPFSSQSLFQVDPGLAAQQQGQPTASSSSTQQPSLMFDPGAGQPGNAGGVKDSIMSLYNVQRPQYNSYTAQGVPVNAYYYHQQQQAAMRMAQQQQQQQHVQQVQQQMEQIKLRQHQPVAVGNGSVPPSGSLGGGQTLNPHLW